MLFPAATVFGASGKFGGRIRQGLCHGDCGSHIVGAFLPAARVYDYEIELFAVEVCVGNADAHIVAQPVDVAAFASAQAVVLLVKVIIVVGKVAHRHQSFAFVFVEFHIQPPFGHA